jgi:hypothetical protein
MKKSRKEFINKLHSEAYPSWKLRIETQFPKLFKKEEKANGWYKDTIRHKWCMFFENGIMKYGVDILGRWSEDLNIPYTLMDNDYKATDKEVGDALIKKAKKKGFEIGIKTEYGAINNNYKHEFRPKTNVFYFGNIEVFNNGKWATIIKEPIVKDVLEVGKWYKTSITGTHYLIKINKLYFNRCFEGAISHDHYGFTNDIFKKKDTWSSTDLSKSLILATNEEVEKAHIKEAKRIGYKGGDNIGNFNGCGKEILYNSNYNFSTNTGLFYVGGCCVCEKGEWATIVENITRKQAEKELGKVITD